MRDVRTTLARFISKAERAGGPELRAAADIARQAAFLDPTTYSADAEHALFMELWGHVSRALDHEDFDTDLFAVVNALEAEMAGHVLSHRLSRGWLVRAPKAPVDFPSFSEATGQSE